MENGTDARDFVKHKGELTYTHQEILETLKIQLGWRGKIEALFKRLQTISKKSGFSAREVRLLRNLLYKEQQDMVDLKQIVENFPGRTLSEVVNYQRDHFP